MYSYLMHFDVRFKVSTINPLSQRNLLIFKVVVIKGKRCVNLIFGILLPNVYNHCIINLAWFFNIKTLQLMSNQQTSVFIGSVKGFIACITVNTTNCEVICTRFDYETIHIATHIATRPNII
jgi:hypothetical protein